MNVAGIVAEYNPMHSGHLYHLRETRERCGADVVVAVMSGSFSQRGEPTIYDKWLRAGAAVKNGVILSSNFLSSMLATARSISEPAPSASWTDWDA